ncbi:hypothetical protein LCGC14_1683220 [marine sediment metagenome]|uniref:Uncharacterized protein n=1 Tax=marine sediment metagenome TaxID=412755 RepID=A0A0F9HNG1_9ZZZZ|nr:hypothetical protein [Candidatus Scalindua sp.]
MEKKKQEEIGGLKIESGIPMPKRQAKGAYEKIVDIMNVDDSIFCKTYKELNRVRLGLINAGKPKEYKFRTGKVEGGFRIWRLK